MTFRQFITSKLFIKQLLLAASAAIAVIWISLKLLDAYTLHGHSITVPNLEGYSESDIRHLLSNMHLTYKINDSIFDEGRPKGSIAAQNPAAGTQVKKNRTIYLTMVAYLPEMIPMPDLNDLSLRQAVALLETYGLRVGILENRPDIAKNAVLQQKYKNGIIEPGTLVEKGTPIDLVVGQGLGDHRVFVPNLIGRSRHEAINILNAANLNIGNEIFLDNDPLDENLKVYRQTPNPLLQDHFLQAGSTVDIYYRSADLFDFKAYLEELISTSAPSLYGKSPQEVEELLDEMDLELGNEFFEDNVSRDQARAYRYSPESLQQAKAQGISRVDVWYRPAEKLNLN